MVQQILSCNLSSSANILSIFVCILCCAGFLYNFSGFARRVSSDTTVTRLKQYHNKSLQLPQIGVCTLSLLNLTDVVKGSGETVADMGILQWHLNQENYQLIGYPATPPPLAYIDPKSAIYNLSWSDFVIEHRIRCQSLLRVCLLNYRPFNCCEFATPILHEKHGVCYAFQHLPNDGFQNDTGPNSGLQMLIELPFATGESRDEIVKPYNQLDAGIVIEYSHKYQMPFSTGAHDQIRVMANTTASISMEANLFERYSTRQSTCSSNTTQVHCNKQCFAGAILQFCNCSLLGYTPSVAETDDDVTGYCHPLHFIHCYGTIMPSKAFQSTYQSCMKGKCIQLCTMWKYDARTSYSALMTEKVLRLQKYDQTREIHNQGLGMVKVQIYYSQLTYQQYYEYSVVTFDNILSDLGGILGLWFGFSIFKICKLLFSASRKISTRQGHVDTLPVYTGYKSSQVKPVSECYVVELRPRQRTAATQRQSEGIDLDRLRSINLDQNYRSIDLTDHMQQKQRSPHNNEPPQPASVIHITRL